MTVRWRAVMHDALGVVRCAVAPGKLVAAAVDALVRARPPRGVHVLAVGKASAGMLEGLDGAGLPLRRVLATMPEAQVATCRVRTHAPVRILACDHPFASSRNVEAAREVAAFVGSTPPDDLLLVLLSGGASAHLTLPREGLALDELLAVSRTLMQGGASIRELNACRKRLETLKGGGLARLRPEGRTEVLVLSDVIGDPLDVIGSGPFTPDATPPDVALAAFDRFMWRGEHGAVRRLLEEPSAAAGGGDACFDHVTHRVIGNNDLAVDAAVEALVSRGVEVRDACRRCEGSVSSWARLLLGAMEGPATTARAWVVGGEPVVEVGDATGVGGPSQELALTLATELDGRAGWMAATFSTDGIDGPTHAAGAIVDGSTCGRARARGLDPRHALATHDSTRALEAAGDLVVTGPTGTNVNHVAMLLRFPKTVTPR